MRVCFVVPYPLRGAAGGGVSRVVLDLSETMKQKGHDVSVIDSLSIRNGSDGVPKSRFMSYLNLVRMLTSRRKRIDIFHLHTAFPTSALGVFVARVLGIPSVITTHGPFVPSDNGPRTRLYLLLERFAFRFADVITFVSRESKEKYGIEGPVILNGIDLKKYKKDELARTETRASLEINNKIGILFSGRIVKEKGIYNLLNALGKLDKAARDQIRLVVVGLLPESDKGAFEKSVETNDLRGVVIYVGFVDDVYPYYCGADLYCFPSVYRGEGLPIVLLEAMACSLPVVASGIGGVQTLIKDGENGILAAMGDEEELKEKLEWCIKFRDRLSGIGKMARMTIERDYDLIQIVDIYIRLYQTMSRH